MEIIELLNRSELIKDVMVLEYKYYSTTYLIYIKVVLKNESVLFITESKRNNRFNYSYHWQAIDGSLIRRWDNAPHHPNIETFPHHCHNSEGIVSSDIKSFQEVLNFIEKAF